MEYKSWGENYNIKGYVADIIQFLLCQEVVNVLQENNFANDKEQPTAYNTA